MKFPSYVPVSIAVFILGFVSAFSLGESEKLTLGKCISEGLKRNVNMVNAELDKRAAELKVDQARSSGLPQIDATIQTMDNLKKNVMLLPGDLLGAPGTTLAMEIGTQYSTTAAVKFNQLLYSQTNYLALEVSKKLTRLSDLKIDKVRDDFIYDLTKMYLLASVTGRQIDLIKTNIARIDSIIDITKIALENGYANPVDLDRATVNKSDLMVQLESTETLLKQQNDLIRYQIDYPKDIEVAEFFESLPGMKEVKPDSTSILARKEIAILELQNELNNDQIEAVKDEYYPSLSLFGQAQYQNLREDYKQFGVKWYPNVYVGLTLSIPIFDGLNKKSRIEQAEVDLQKSETSLRDTKNYFKTDFEQSVRENDKCKSALSRRKQNVDLAAKIVEVSKTKHTEGSFAMSDLLTDEISLCNAELNYLSAQFNLLVSELNLMKSTGKLNILATK